MDEQALKLLCEEATKCVNEAKRLAARADAEGRDMNGEENAEFDRLMAVYHDAAAKLQAAQQKAARREQLANAQRELDQQSRGRVGGAGGGPDLTHRGDGVSVRYRNQVLTYAPGSDGYARNTPQGIDSFRRAFKAAMRTDDYTQGGALVMPEEIWAGVLRSVDDALYIRSLATAYITDAQTFGVPTVTARVNTFQWGTELTNSNNVADTSFRLGRRSLTPHPTIGAIDVSNDLIRSSGGRAEEIVGQEMARNMAETMEKAYLTGHGAGQPLGLFVASNDGIPTSRDSSTGNTSTAVTADGIINCLYSLKQNYVSKARWIVSRAFVSAVTKLKGTTNGDFLWQPGLQNGAPGTILGVPIIVSEYAPSTFTANSYVALLGDFSNYWIVDGTETSIQRLVETKAHTNETQFIWRGKSDAAPVRAEAFARLQLAASG